jgi:glycosyltransferase involved in cell wall biosynthesis
LAAQVLDRSHVEVLVVSNIANLSQSQDCRLIADEGLSCRYLISSTSGANSARNTGARQAQGDFIYYLDDDCRLLTKDHLTQVISTCEAHPHIVAIGGLYLTSPQANRWERAYNQMANAWCLSHHLKKKQSSVLLGGNICLRKMIFIKGFSFNEDILYGGTETDFFYRLRQADYSLALEPALSVEHQPSIHSASFWSRAWRQGTGKVHLPRHRHRQRFSKFIKAICKLPENKLLIVSYVAVAQVSWLLAKWTVPPALGKAKCSGSQNTYHLAVHDNAN